MTGCTKRILVVLASVFWAAALQAQTYSGSNGVYDVFVTETGEYTAQTGALHPTPYQNVFYDGVYGAPWTTWNSVRSYDSDREYVLMEPSLVAPSPSAGYSCDGINWFFSPTLDVIGSTGVRVSWRIQNGVDDLSVVQEVNAEGTTFSDSVVRVTVCITNNRPVTARTGIRFQWDWQISDNDGAWIGIRPPHPPLEPFIGDEREWTNPSFEFYDVSDSEWPSIFPSTYRVGGTVTGPPLAQGPIPPAKLQYASWADIVNTCFDYDLFGLSVGDYDSAVSYYWGPTSNNAIVLPPGQSYCATQYVFVFTDEPPPLCELSPSLAGGRACAGESVALDASGSVGNDCAGGALQFQFVNPGGGVVQAWSADATYDATMPGHWQVEVRCVSDPTCAATAYADVVLTTIDAALAGAVACEGSSADIDASGSTAANCPSLEYKFFDPSGAVARDWSPVSWIGGSVPGTWSVQVRCATDVACLDAATASLVVERPTRLAAGTARDIASCNLGIELAWDAATWPDAAGGTYAVHRSTVSCADALAQPPLASGIVARRFDDDGTVEDGTYFYAILAESTTPAQACTPTGPGGGSTATLCLAPVSDELNPTQPAPICWWLRVSHAGDLVTLEWSGARALLADEHAHVRKRVGDAEGALGLASAEGLIATSWSETDTSSRLQFFDVRYADLCESESIDDEPPGFDPPQGIACP